MPLDISADLKQELRLLDRFYIPTRYPVALPGSIEDGLPNEEDATTALESAKKLFSSTTDHTDRATISDS